jgi:glycine cleavage system regulatory protein
MNVPLVMTVIGTDRPGLVESLASAVAGHGGSWLESRMSRLGGHFAGILRVEVPAPKQGVLVEALRKLESGGLQVVVHESPAESAGAARKWVSLELVGQDRPGIIRQISSILTQHWVNVEELQTERVSAPMSGEPLFQARAQLYLPEGCNVPALRRDLEKIAADLMVDFTLAAR